MRKKNRGVQLPTDYSLWPAEYREAISCGLDHTIQHSKEVLDAARAVYLKLDAAMDKAMTMEQLRDAWFAASNDEHKVLAKVPYFQGVAIAKKDMLKSLAIAGNLAGYQQR
jgi:hypothetical protein